MNRFGRFGAAGINQWRSVPRPLWSIGIATLISRSGGFLALFGSIYLAAIDLSSQEIVVTLGAAGVLGVAGVTFSGFLVDRFSPKRVLVGTSLLNACLLVALALVPNHWVSMVAVVIASVLTQVFLPIASTIVASISDSGNRIPYFAAFRIFVNLGSLVSPVIAAALGSKHWMYLFLFSAAVNIVSAVVIAVSPDGSRRKPEPPSKAATTSSPSMPAPDLLRLLLLFGLFAIIAAVYAQSRSTIPLQVTRDQPLTFYSALLVMNALMGLLVELPLSTAIRKVPWRYSLGAGAVLMTVGLAVTGITASIAPLAIAGFAVFTFGEMIFAPVVSAAVASIAPPTKVARYQGYLSSAQSLGFSLGPAIGVAYFLQIGSAFWYYLGGIGCLAALAVVIVARWIHSDAVAAESTTPEVEASAPAVEGNCSMARSQSAGMARVGLGHANAEERITMKTVLVVDPVSTGALYSPLLAARGAEVYEVVTSRSRGYHLGEKPPTTVSRLSYDKDFGTDSAALARFCRENEIETVIAGTEPGVPLVEEVRALLDAKWSNDKSTARARFDKGEMLEALAKNAVDSLEFVAIESDAQARQHFANFDFENRSVVVKPAESAGSVDVVHVTSASEANSVVQGLLGKAGLFGERVQRLVAQEYFAGAEFVVDTFSSAGEHAVTNICQYEKTRSATGHFVYNGLTWLDQTHPDASRLTEYALQVLDALGVRNGASHLEIMADESRTVLIDFGSRAHGAAHPMKTFQLTGDSHLHREVDYIATGHNRTAGFSLRKRGKILFFSRDKHSVMIAASPLDAFANIDGIESISIEVKTGAVVPPTTNLLEGLDLGMCYIIGDDEDKLMASQADARAAFDSLFADAT
ncbi:MFS transporter [Leifsonia sp. Le1]|uniref:MFS transporter n=1 Tax=Leifsonia sp. Le1 TaxID=3404918 RepID=UPI003EBD6516